MAPILSPIVSEPGWGLLALAAILCFAAALAAVTLFSRARATRGVPQAIWTAGAAAAAGGALWGTLAIAGLNADVWSTMIAAGLGATAGIGTRLIGNYTDGSIDDKMRAQHQLLDDV